MKILCPKSSLLSWYNPISHHWNQSNVGKIIQINEDASNALQCDASILYTRSSQPKGKPINKIRP